MQAIKNMSLSLTAFVITLLTTVIVVAVVVANMTVVQRSLRTELFARNVENAMYAKLAMVDQQIINTLYVGISATSNVQLANAIAQGSAPQIAYHVGQSVETLKDFVNFDLVVITDAQGNVLHSTGPQVASGTNLSHIPSVAQATQRHTVYSEVEVNGILPFAGVSAVPIYTPQDSTTPVGAIIIAVNLANEAFVDEIERITGMRVTMFAGTERVMTSVVDNHGHRGLGTQLPADIAGYVIGLGLHLFDSVPILGRNHYAYYLPIIDSQHQVVGAFSVGMDMTYIEAQVNRMTLTTTLIGTAILVIGLMIAYLLNNTFVSKPINAITSAFNDLAKGNFNTNMPIYTRENEIGQLARAGTGLSQVMNRITMDTQGAIQDYLDGSLKAGIPEANFEGDFKNVATGINKLIGRADFEVSIILEVLKGFAHGDFDVPMEQLPGEKQSYNQVTEHVRKELKEIAHLLAFTVAQAKVGNLSERADTSSHEGSWAMILDNINELMEVITTPINEMQEILKDMHVGDFSTEMEGTYEGIFNDMKICVNETNAFLRDIIENTGVALSYMTNNNDFTHYLEGNYKGSFVPLQTGINGLIDKLNKMLGEISANVSNLLEGATAIANTSEIIADGASNQASSINELSGSLKELSRQITVGSVNAKEANGLALASLEHCTEGNQHMQSTLTAMGDISEASKNILSILKVIEDIAFQTNLLALNAAVEAARAGEHGRGFAIVAEEVRALAARSDAASKETNDKIQDIIGKITLGQSSTEHSAEAFQAIVSSVSKVEELVHSIENQSQEQAAIIQNISGSTTQISDVVSHNMSLSEESAAASQELNERAESMDELVKGYKIFR